MEMKRISDNSGENHLQNYCANKRHNLNARWRAERLNQPTSENALSNNGYARPNDERSQQMILAKQRANHDS